jgi:A/G-specific adenine glycosylase
MIAPMKRRTDQEIQLLLLKWFGKNRRDLPWRKTKDPYRIWVSEIMLQQTQVKTVIPYYKRWMKTFPNLRSLAAAPLSRVLKGWEGLGYYSRARNLHRGAREVVKRFEGRVPDSRESLQKLPGIGRYTAGAIASIAFGKPEPVVDGNVKRVLSRVFALKEPIDTSRGEAKLWEIAKNLLRRNGGRYGDFNQALMELGALVCLPENPRCTACPLEKRCKSRRLGKEEGFPVKSRKEKVTELRTVAAVIWKKGRVLLKREPLNGRWGGLWTFPQWVSTNGAGEKKFLKERVGRDLKVSLRTLNPRAELKHGFTKYRVRLRVYEGEVLSSPRKLSWVRPENLARLPLPRPHQKIADFVRQNPLHET